MMADHGLCDLIYTSGDCILCVFILGVTNMKTQGLTFVDLIWCVVNPDAVWYEWHERRKVGTN